ncbi:hypothetical protein JT55_03375 [Rhodovulum sp. NI22]|nr:hypothetical protein JT55_03375 [Rhodovulum sp. NI22]
MPEDQQLQFQRVKDRRALSVQVYDQLVDVLRKDAVPGALIPPELQLSQDLGVSRTVLREALRLLEEDGVIERAVDPRRRQLAQPGSNPPAFNAPLEQMLSVSGEMSLRVVRHGPLAPTSWSRNLLETPPDCNEVITRETLFLQGDEPIASALEVVTMEVLKGARPIDAGAPPATLLHDLGPKFRSKCVATLWRLSKATSGGRSRAGFKDIDRDVPLVTLTTVLRRNGKPVFLAKYLLRLDMLSLNVGNI